MIKVHHLNNSRSQRVLWLLEELDVPYELVCYQRDRRTMLAPPALRAVHPLGKSPVVTQGETAIAETGAIVEYILEHHGGGRLAPTNSEAERLAFRYWLHYAEGSAMPPLVMKLIFTSIPSRVPLPLRPLARLIAKGAQSGYVDPQLELHKDYWQAALRPSGWFVGADFSAADIMMSFPLEAAASRSPFGAARPALQDFLTRIHGRPAYRRALERGGPYAYA